MHNLMVEKRLQGIIDMDIRRSNQIAVKTKLLNKKLHFSNTKTELKQSEINEQTKELLLSNERLSNIRHLLDERQAEYVRIKQQLSRMKKKKRHDVLDDGTVCYLSDADRNIHFKKMLKLNLLHQCTKLDFTEIKSQQKIIQGYVSLETDLFPFEEKFSMPADSDEIKHALWNEIKAGSENIVTWNELFLDDILDGVNLTII